LIVQNGQQTGKRSACAHNIAITHIQSEHETSRTAASDNREDKEAGIHCAGMMAVHASALNSRFKGSIHNIIDRKMAMHDLSFNTSHVKILQFTDLHFGEADERDRMSMQMTRSVVSVEMPDFVVFSGDIVSGYAVRSEEQRLFLWQRALASVGNVPFATLFGNHDDQPYRFDPLLWHGLLLNAIFAVAISTAVLVYAFNAKRKLLLVLLSLLSVCIVAMLATAPSNSVRLSLIDHERHSFPSLSYTQRGPNGVHGVSNYRLIFKTPQGSVALIFLDSGGGRIPEAIHQSQIDWLRSTRTDMPSIAFIHIPPFPNELYDAKCSGDPPLEATSALKNSDRLLNTLAEIHTSAVFVGHDHGNAWCCNHSQMLLCYGRHSGYGGYTLDSKSPGARVIELHTDGELRTWISNQNTTTHTKHV
jgi:3',5'-cyclic AMP phosphodiesterase CpdA